MNHRALLDRFAATVLVLLLLCAVPRVSVAQESIKPLAVDEKAFGLTLTEWATAWAQWWMSIPAGQNPRNDRTGTRSGTGQRLPVWFIAPDPGGRTVPVPPGASILVPGVWGVAWVGPGVQSEEEMAALLDRHLEGEYARFPAVDVTLDGILLPDIRQYHIRSGHFTVVAPPNNLLGFTVTAGNDHRAVAMVGGDFYLLPPLSLGKHAIAFRGDEVDPSSGRKTAFVETVTLIVQNPNDPLP